MRLSCADYTWPAVPHRIALELISRLGFHAVDLGFMYGRSHIRPDVVGADLDRCAGQIAERCAGYQLDVADVFAQAPSFETMAVNHPDPEQRRAAADFFERAVAFATRVGSPGITVLPGIEFPEDEWAQALDRSARTLREYVTRAHDAGLRRLSVEPHIGSIVDTPERAAALVDAVPELQLTLDYGHYTAAGFTDEQIEPLVSRAGHVHCRGAAPGILQADMRSNTIDFPRMVRQLEAVRYSGYFTCEYVWSQWQECDRVDNLTQTVILRDILSRC